MKCIRGASLAIALATLVSIPLIAKAQYLQDGVNYVPNKIVIAIKAQYAPVSPVTQGGVIVTGLNDIDALNRQFSVTKMTPLFPKAEEHGEPAMAGYYSLIFTAGPTLEAALRAYAALGSIEHVEPVGIHRVYYTPNDPFITSQWGLTNTDARTAWNTARGDTSVKLGIADTGVDWDHPDIDGNLWHNAADPIDGVDNDGNGYIDDYRGWDWVDGEIGAPGEDATTPDNNPMDFDGHGTHVSGIASAETNNATGIAGMGFHCSIMALRIGWEAPDGNGYVEMSFAASAFYYAANKGAKAVNCSWGSSNSGGIATAANYAVNHGVVIVSAAGNDNTQTAPYLCSRSDVISVAAIDASDQRASWSNYGNWVDVCAPGVNIYSTYFNDTYQYLDGTSMAAPFVTGLVGLIRAAAPSYTAAQTRTRIASTAINIDASNPGYEGLLGSGKINAANAVAGLGILLTTPTPVSPINSVWLNTPHPTFVWSDTSQANVYHVQAARNTSFSPLDVNDSTIYDTSYVATDSLVDGSSWFWRVSGGLNGFWTDYSSPQEFRIDTRRPNTTTLLTPTQNSWTNNHRPNFTWNSVTDVGGSGIHNYQIQIDNDTLFAAPHLIDDSTTLTHYTPTIDIFGDGRIFWRVRARDNAGNYALYASGYYNLDTTPPASPISFNASPDGWTSNANFTLSWTNPGDPSGIVQARYKVGAVPTSNADTTGHFSGVPPATYIANNTGVWQIYLWLVDGVGNTSFTHRGQDSIRFDNTPPSGSIASSPPVGGRSFTVSWSAGSDIGSGLAGIYDVRYRDGSGGVWTNWLVGINGLSSSFANGAHNHTYYFEARARDIVGNLEPFTGIPETQTIVDTSFTGPPFVPGDANGSGDVNGLDVVYLVSYLKGGPPPPDPILRGDANGSCSVNGLDVTYLVSYLKGGPLPFAGNCR